MRRIFLDVGANYGQTLEVALDPRYAFDLVYAFEPAKSCLRILDRFRDPRLVIAPFGLGASNQTLRLYEPGSLAGSIYRGVDVPEEDAEIIEVRDASAWLAQHVTSDDEVYVKLNCEGSEADIIERLHQTGHLALVDHALLSLDIERFPAEAVRAETVLQLLDDAGVDYTRREEIGYLVATWLLPIAESNRSPLARFRFWTGAHLRTDRRVRRIVRSIIGEPVYQFAAGRIGPSRRGLDHRAGSDARWP